MIGKVCFVEKDLFGISDRLREIDEGYFVVYSYRRRRFEVHHKEQRGNSLAFVVPFDRLDARTVDYARRTARTRADTFLEEIRRENAKKEGLQKKEAVEKAMKMAERLL